MRTAAFAFAALLFAGASSAQQATAQQTTPQPPDYSRPALLRVFADQPEQPERRVEYPFGAVTIEGRTTRWLIGYLPFLMPLSGSVNTGRGFGSNVPNPFALTHTDFPYTPRTGRDTRGMSRELRRIESEERKRAKVSATPE
jgi:hypothetical protein